MTISRSLAIYVLIFLTPFVLPRVVRAQPPAAADDFALVQAEDPKICAVEGRVETHIYPRSVGRKMAMLHPGSRFFRCQD